MLLQGIEEVKGSDYRLVKTEADKLLTMLYGTDALAAWDVAGVGTTRRMAVLEWTMKHLSGTKAGIVHDS